MGDSLLRWLGRDKPSQHRVRHTAWKKQLADRTRQLLLDADRARQRTELEMLDGADVYRAAAGEEPEEGDEGEGEMWEDWDAGD